MNTSRIIRTAIAVVATSFITAGLVGSPAFADRGRGGGSDDSPSVSVPSVSVPSVSVPSVSVPSVSTPSVSTPRSRRARVSIPLSRSASVSTPGRQSDDDGRDDDGDRHGRGRH